MICKMMVAMVALVACTRHAALSQNPSPAGTYVISLCKGAPCSPDDTSRALTWGVLVLADTAISFALLPDSASRLLYPLYLRAPANGCFALRLPNPDAQTYAGGIGAGVTRWEVDTARVGGISFTLYRSPDARHVTRALLTTEGFRGSGKSSGAAAAKVHYPLDTVVARRVGPPDFSPCVEASAREWRRIRTMRPRS
jgi:hypothetical protein